MPFDLKFAVNSFFDRPAVANALEQGNKRALSKIGAFIRQRARTSIRKRKKASDPGQPPSSHVGFLKKGILFAYDAASKSVVVGPILSSSQSGAPERLEYGGTGVVGPKKKPRVAKYPARPYMRPAFMAELPKMPEQYKGQIK